MTLRNGRYVCDRDGVDVGNGGVDQAAIVSDLDPDTGNVRVLHFCRDRQVDGKTVKGCAGRVLTAKALADYLAQGAS